MPPKQFETIWRAEPHTIAKIVILKAYLKAWFPILGQTMLDQPVLYVDGFAGPGEYTNYPDGSPVAALAAAREAVEGLGEKWIAGPIYCTFIEEDTKRYENLKTRLKDIPAHPKIHVQTINSNFVDGIDRVRKELPKFFTQKQPLFVFVDPFGATGVPFSVIKDILASPCSEVLINHDADGIGRIFKARSGEEHDRLLDCVFGDRSWGESLRTNCDFPVVCRQILELYKDQLRSIPGVKYVFPFEMRSKTDLVNYHLVFASQNPKGLEKMKEAMQTMDQSGGYSFSDGRVNQPLLFRFDRPEEFAVQLHHHFLGREASYKEMLEFALNETPFLNPKAMLKVLEKEELIVVQSLDLKRHRGHFKEATLISVRFVPAKPTQPKQGELFGGT